MRKPNHIILDFGNINYSSTNHYWAFSFLESRNTQPHFLSYTEVSNKHIKELKHRNLTFNSSGPITKPKKFTVKITSRVLNDPIVSKYSTFIKNLPNHKHSTLDKGIQKNLLKYSKGTPLDSKLFLTLKPLDYSYRNMKRLFRKNWSNHTNPTNNPELLLDVINVNFLRKERMYTKLKYSRTPAYDIVSGGAAALLAGFIGFLISEKFGFELVDSGDFYFFFMYVVFIAFSVRPLLMVANPERGFFDVVSPRRIMDFYRSLFLLFVYKIKHLLK